MRHTRLIRLRTPHVLLALAGGAALIANARIIGLNRDRDTIVENEFQASYCQDKPERTSICSDAFSLSQSATSQIVIDSIFFKVATPGIISSHATFKIGQRVLKFAFHHSGNQVGYPWIFSEYNDSGVAKVSITPFQNAEFSGFEIDECLYSCPDSQSGPVVKLEVTAFLIFVSKNQRDTLTLMGLQNQGASPIKGIHGSGTLNGKAETVGKFRSVNGRRIDPPPSQGNPVFTYPFPR
jgi:hypothetical protein